ncbi:amidase domain-containing protein [Priestia taiwanensis]|uniref:Putative amidase domain-containing protein n=1 Tax=Priestia taiwanensis TaxID=1347902 RepID=A0A917AHN2_9BACI|nr:amidase domain-containing protein [Priestia taiwanensis]MBM7361380.1 hypothetical protein [Priestia taiwanensis]GGE53711.1 hypothetical protein GCM10007140_00030 [Priestia taiwanensis]
MKKIIISMLSLSFGLVSIAPLSANATTPIETNKKEISVEELGIKGAVDKYFKWYFESVNDLSKSNIAELDKIIKNDNLKEFQLVKAKLKNEWYKEFNNALASYDVSINYDNVDINGNEANVSVRVGNSVRDKNNLDVLQEEGLLDHKLLLIKDSGNWYVKDDYFTDSSFDYNFDEKTMKETSDQPLVTRTKELKENLVNIEMDFKNYKKTLEITQAEQEKRLMPRFYGGYNGQAAANYALRWAEGQNPAYNFYPNVDCTNFVSQALVAGGVRQDGTWFSKGVGKADSNAWVRVLELRNWLVNKGYAKETIRHGNGKVGNLVQLFSTKKNRYSHTVIITASNPRSGEIFVSAHSDPKRNAPLSSYYMNFSTERHLDLY